MNDTESATHWVPWRGMALYLALGAVWVTLGDELLTQLVTDPVRLVQFQMWKAWSYVLLTSAVAYVLLKQIRRADRVNQSLSQELTQFARHAPVGFARATAEGRFLWANDRLRELMQLSDGDVGQYGLQDVLVPPDVQWTTDQLSRLLAGDIDHYMVERECRPPNGGPAVPVLCTVTRVPALGERAAQLLCVVQDLAEIKAAREALVSSEAQQRLADTVVDNSIEGVVVSDASSRILSVNAAVTRLLGYTEAELLGKTPRVFASGRHDRAFYEAMWAQVHATGHWEGEIWNRRKSGEVFPEYMSLSSVRDPEGKVTHYVCMFTDISEDKAQLKRMEQLARNDALTGLSNRSWVCQQLEQLVQEAQDTGECFGVLLLNLDRFKDVNDSYGHAVGDQVLRHIVRQVQAALRPGDLLGRFAGDELVVVARHLRHAEGAAAVSRNLIDAVAVPWHSPDGFEVVAGVSVGICMYPEHASTAELLLQGAHAAVYGAKARGRRAWCFFQEAMTQAARERIALESRLRQALAEGHFLVYYQPQVDIATGRIIGAEALVRWNDPEEGLISPAKFIPVAETSGVIGPLGEWVIREVCRQGQVWRTQGLPDVTLAVNVSPRQFHLTDLVGRTLASLNETGFPHHLLELEITESALAERVDDARKVLTRLREIGVRVAVDDFGTGYSSLAQLKRFPIDVLKIDQGFIRDVPQSADDMAISSAIIAMAHSMGMTVLAEGVETQGQLDFLRERGCNTYQGYLKSRPVPADEFAQMLKRSTAEQD